MRIRNPYIKPKYRLLNAIDKKQVKDRKKSILALTIIENANREYIQGIMNRLKQKFDVAKERLTEIKKSGLSARKQLQEARRLYREVMGYKTKKEGVLIHGLVNEIRDLKEMLRNEITGK